MLKMRLDKQEVSAQKPCHIEQGASAQQHFKQQVSSPNFTKPVTHEHRGSAQQPCKQQVSIRTSHHLIAKTYQITHTHTRKQGFAQQPCKQQVSISIFHVFLEKTHKTIYSQARVSAYQPCAWHVPTII